MSETIGANKPFHGWRLSGGLLAILFFTGGGGFYVFPVFIDSLQKEFGWTMTQISVSAGIFAIVFGVSSPVVGILFVRLGARKTMLIAAAIAGLVQLGFALMTELWMFYVINLAAGFAVAGTTLVPVQTLITNWFNKYRGRAMSVTMVGIGAGGFLLPLLHGHLIRQGRLCRGLPRNPADPDFREDLARRNGTNSRRRGAQRDIG